MCGVTGFVEYNSSSNEEQLKLMVDTIEHRGPNHKGLAKYRFKDYTVALGHVRLSVIDLSDSGNQPMEYLNYSIIYNGEVYNYKELKRELEELGHEFSTSSDTEVILHSFYEWGTDAVKKFIGMFVIVLFDKEAKTINILRDRAGVKPLYYSFQNGLFLFASELKALMSHPLFSKNINLGVLKNFLNLGYIAAPDSVFQNTYKLKPGTKLTYDISKKTIKLNQYWNVNQLFSRPKLVINYNDAKDELHKLLISACQYRMISDVPVGLFLSGGYDSALVASILQRYNNTQLKTFTIGFDTGNNEAQFARKTAKMLGTEHCEFICSENSVIDIIYKLPYYYDEPFGDSSAIPTTLVSQIASKEVKVVLSADGGDEVFGGYDRYYKHKRYSQFLNLIPSILKPTISSYRNSLKWSDQFINEVTQHKITSYLCALNKDRNIQSRNFFKYTYQKPSSYIDKFFSQQFNSIGSPYDIEVGDFIDSNEIPMALDYQSYLPNDILTKVDRATMSASIEGREPLLDHRLIEYSAQLPLEYKFNRQMGKIILKDIVHDYLPKEIMHRPKTGFTLPIYDWLRKGKLSFLLDEYLNVEALGWSGILNVDFVKGEIQKFKENRLHYTPVIWYLLMFQMWFKRWMM